MMEVLWATAAHCWRLWGRRRYREPAMAAEAATAVTAVAARRWCGTGGAGDQCRRRGGGGAAAARRAAEANALVGRGKCGREQVANRQTGLNWLD